MIHLRLLAAICACASLLPAQLTVTAVSPARNAVGAPTATRISIGFAQALDPASVTPARFHVFGRWSGVMTGALSLRNGDREIVFEPARPFFPGESVTVALPSAVRGAGGEVLNGGHAWMFWTAAAPGSYQFTDVAVLSTRRQGEGRVRTCGAYAGDLDRDGTPDLSLPNEDSSDVRIMYGSCGTFGPPVVRALPSGSVPSPNEGEDFNGDGWIDLAVGCPGAGTVAVYLNDGSGGYLNPTIQASGANPRGIAVLDVDADGDVDIVAASYGAQRLTLHRNNGDGTFAAATTLHQGGQMRGVVAADINNDGWLDLFAADFSGAVHVLLANGSGGFALGANAVVPGQPWMIAAGDVNGDGNADVVSVNSSDASVSVVLGNGLGGLAPAVNYPVGTFAIAIDLGDLDGDGDLDLVASSYSSADFSVYRNAGNGSFGSRFTLPTTAAGSCALIVDYDRDGDLDILGIDELDDTVHLFRQNGPSPSGVQAPRCDATLRVDGFANRGGYGTAPVHDATNDHRLYLGVSSVPNATYVVLVGTALEPGIASPLGVFNLNSVLVSFPAGTTTAVGEGQQAFVVPPLTAGSLAAFQAALLVNASPLQIQLSNPEAIVIRP